MNLESGVPFEPPAIKEEPRHSVRFGGYGGYPAITVEILMANGVPGATRASKTGRPRV